MDFLLDPNVAFLLLLTGVLLGVLAALTPGTGLLEISAFFCLAGAGYGAYNLPFNWWALLILAMSAIPIIFAFQKSRRELWLGLSILGLVGGAALTFASVNPLLAIVASGMVGAFLWIAVRKSVQAAQSRPVHDLKALVGRTGEAKTKVHEEGSVQVAGELWSARSEQPIKTGSPVRVVRVDGFVVVVEPADS